MNIGNGSHVKMDDCENNGDFGIGYNYNDVSNYNDSNYDKIIFTFWSTESNNHMYPLYVKGQFFWITSKLFYPRQR